MENYRSDEKYKLQPLLRITFCLHWRNIFNAAYQKVDTEMMFPVFSLKVVKSETVPHAIFLRKHFLFKMSLLSK